MVKENSPELKNNNLIQSVLQNYFANESFFLESNDFE